MASGSGTAGSQSSVGESEGQSGPGAADPKFPLWAYVEKLIPTATTAAKSDIKWDRERAHPGMAMDVVVAGKKDHAYGYAAGDLLLVVSCCRCCRCLW